MPSITLRGDHLTLAQALKASGLTSSGGEAKHLIRGGTVRVNGQVELQPGRKLRAGDAFQVAEGEAWSVEGSSGS